MVENPIKINNTWVKWEEMRHDFLWMKEKELLWWAFRGVPRSQWVEWNGEEYVANIEKEIHEKVYGE